jgi:flavin reductase (DIM6/NTAB) family NADH-FMN oxidoreductase RutF
MAEKDIHYYEPANGHGLKHDPFNAIVAPRPIGWISSRGTKVNINLAPYSFFNAFCYKPPIVGFSSTAFRTSRRRRSSAGISRSWIWPSR